MGCIEDNLGLIGCRISGKSLKIGKSNGEMEADMEIGIVQWFIEHLP